MTLGNWLQLTPAERCNTLHRPQPGGTDPAPPAPSARLDVTRRNSSVPAHEQAVPDLVQIPKKSVGIIGRDRRVKIWDRQRKRKLTGMASPLEVNLKVYLKEHPHSEPYNGQDLPEQQVEQAGGKTRQLNGEVSKSQRAAPVNREVEQGGSKSHRGTGGGCSICRIGRGKCRQRGAAGHLDAANAPSQDPQPVKDEPAAPTFVAAKAKHHKLPTGKTSHISVKRTTPAVAGVWGTAQAQDSDAEGGTLADLIGQMQSTCTEVVKEGGRQAKHIHHALHQQTAVWYQLHRHLAATGGKIRHYPFICYKPVDLAKLWLLVEAHGGYEALCNDGPRMVRNQQGDKVQWSRGNYANPRRQLVLRVQLSWVLRVQISCAKHCH